MNEANVNACISHLDEQARRALLPTYSELLIALHDLEWAVDGIEYVQKEYAAEVKAARDLLVHFDTTGSAA